MNLDLQPVCVVLSVINTMVSHPGERDALVQCWAIVVDSGPTLNRRRFDVSCLFGCT